MNQELLRKYARTLLQSGVNLQEKQTLIVSVDVDNKDFAVIVTEEAYQLGAKEVIINWRHTPITRQRLLHADASVLETPAKWIPVYYEQYVEEKAAFLSLISANPKALAGIPTEHISLNSRNLNKVLAFFSCVIDDFTIFKGKGEVRNWITLVDKRFCTNYFTVYTIPLRRTEHFFCRNISVEFNSFF